MTGPERPTPEERRAFRAFVWTHHPDVGGDPAAFAEALRRWRPPGPTRGTAAGGRDMPSFHHRRRGAGVFLDWLLDRRRRRRRPPRVR